MGRASRDKWIKRAETFEDVAASAKPDASKAFLDRYSKKLHKFIKGAGELAEERAQDALENPEHEPEG